ncbi:CvpA family protein [Halobacillus amylolyticus]|uniref:CvpA family protein n=1 Tax=Halobacillus amylolyticus TaxID=2932259 RepID=A0ABY4HGV9_9BACI|nr:CvpA family protein [Halobacillus amylolyticus]UOR13864.1 CvpA family protein [Halobacillus amylolyticus]
MIDLLLLIILFLGVMVGFRRGFILQLFHLIGFIAAFIVAVMYYDNLAPKLILWVPYPELPEGASWAIFMESLPLEQAFYNASAFAILFFGVKIILQIIASMLDFVSELPVLSSLNSLLGGILGFVERYFLLFILLYIAALVPLGVVQNALDGSFLAQFIIEKTPILSSQIKTMWVEQVITLL